MQLQAVIVPPPAVVEDALEGVHALAPATSTAAEPARGVIGRLLGRRQPATQAGPTVSLLPTAPEAVFIRLAKFGNVAAGDAAGLASALQGVARKWPVPDLHVTKLSVAAEHPFDITAQLDGDLDALREIFAGVAEVARRERFFIDRRTFRCELPVGTIEVAEGAPVPDGVVGTELDHQGPRWSPTHITLFRTAFTDNGTTFAEVARVQLTVPGGGLGDTTAG